MSSPEGLDLAAKLEVAANVLIFKNTKAVDNRDQPPGPSDHIVGLLESP